MARKKKTDLETAAEVEAVLDDSFDFGANVKTEGPMAGLPVFGQVIPKGAGKLALQSEAQRRSIAAAKTSAEERTIPMPFIATQGIKGASLDSGKHFSNVIRDTAIDGVMNVLDAAKKKGTSEDITEKLTESLVVAKLPAQDSDTQNPETTEEDTTMAAKKKSAAKKPAKKSTKQTVNAANGSNKVKTAAPIGRERKLLLRLSVEEYKALQEKAAAKETSMANLLRTSALGAKFNASVEE